MPPAAVPALPPSSAVPPSVPAGKAQALPVYYVGETKAGPRLYREFHRVTTGDPASDAVREMLAPALDPDYRTHWPSGTSLRSPVVAKDGVLTVDLAGIGNARVSTELAGITVQQLVFTVQGALQSSDPVRILVDGKQVDELWGAVPTTQPVPRGDALALRSLVQIDTPMNGASVVREFEVSGEAAVFEATVQWEVLQNGRQITNGSTSSAEGQRFSPYRITLNLAPGEYTVRVLEDDPSGGAGRPVLTDDKSVTVTG